VGTTPRGPYVAALFIGSLAAGATSDLPAATTDLAESVLHTYYPHEHPRGAIEPELTEVGGRPACRLEVALDVDDPSLAVTSETALFLLVDLGGAAPAVVYASLPETDHVPSAGEVIEDLRVTPG
jgi:hypothetical protein